MQQMQQTSKWEKKETLFPATPRNLQAARVPEYLARVDVLKICYTNTMEDAFINSITLTFPEIFKEEIKIKIKFPYSRFELVKKLLKNLIDGLNTHNRYYLLSVISSREIVQATINIALDKDIGIENDKLFLTKLIKLINFLEPLQEIMDEMGNLFNIEKEDICSNVFLNSFTNEDIALLFYYLDNNFLTEANAILDEHPEAILSENQSSSCDPIRIIFEKIKKLNFDSPEFLRFKELLMIPTLAAHPYNSLMQAHDFLFPTIGEQINPEEAYKLLEKIPENCLEYSEAQYLMYVIARQYFQDDTLEDKILHFKYMLFHLEKAYLTRDCEDKLNQAEHDYLNYFQKYISELKRLKQFKYETPTKIEDTLKYRFLCEDNSNKETENKETTEGNMKNYESKSL